MIILRTGYILRERGIPAFNRIDVAQPSTSYIAPYLFAGLLELLRPNVAIVFYALLGLFSVAGTATIIVWYSRSTTNALLLVLLLLSTSTNLMFALNGWDHLFQGFFLAFATALSLQPGMTSRRMLAASFLLVLGTLCRPDGLILSLGILAVLYLATRSRQFILFGAAPYMVLVGAALALNLHQFGHLTPTTARLKFGAAPSLGYILKYIVANGLLSYSVLTLLVMLTVFYFAFSTTVPRAKGLIVISCCLVTAAIALYNSDWLGGARMIWSPVCVLAVLIAVSSPALFSSSKRRLVELLDIAPMYLRQPSASPSQHTTAGFRAFLAFMTVVVLGSLASLIAQRHKSAVVTQNSFYESLTAQQFFISQWIASNLTPGDGSIGFFHLGVSYDLPRFEIADFNGLADESIATLKTNPGGMPGHNKWNVSKTLDKWNPQAIVPGGPIDPTRPETRANSLTHAPYLLSNSKITGEYAYCYVPDSAVGMPDKWGFYLRKDIATRHLDQLKCPTEQGKRQLEW
ncbi:hypothetical protein FTO74_05750 [Granulicella sp. WH15]|nr:hypothetical protein FTO74_05750 [Granulicella sp. WH15]